MSDLPEKRNEDKKQLNAQFSERGLIIRDDDQDWGSAGLNDIQQDKKKINQ